MYWIIAPLVIVAFLFAAGFRKAALGLLIVAVVAGALIYRHNEQVQQRASTRISASEISLENVAVTRTFDASYELTGEIKNKSDTYRVDGISLKVKMRDCSPKDASQCVVAGEAAAHAPVTVPPQQTRAFTATLYFGKSHRQPKGTIVWDYEIETIMAKRQ